MVRLPPLFNTWGERTFELVMGREFLGKFFLGRVYLSRRQDSAAWKFFLCVWERGVSVWIFWGAQKKERIEPYTQVTTCAASLLFVCVYRNGGGPSPPKLRKSV